MIELLDTTLRDGMQGYGITYSLADKMQIIAAMRALGIHYIEIGNPSSNPIDKELASSLKGDDLVLFGATHRKGISADEDSDLVLLAESKIRNISIFGKSSAMQAQEIIGVNKLENLELIGDTIRYLINCGKRIIFDAEHYFDGFLEDSEYALSVIDTALNSGATTIVLCDTNGGTSLDNIADITRKTILKFPNTDFGIHCHNDCGLAVAQSLIAINNGIKHVQGTLLGYGERCGNTSLSTIIPNITLKLGYDSLPLTNLTKLRETACKVAELANINLEPNLPFIGENAFTHKAGMHCNAVIKSPDYFEQINPSLVGNERNLLISLLSGRASVTDKLRQYYPKREFSADEIRDLLAILKERETDGYSYETAEASFFLLCQKQLGLTGNCYELNNYSMITDNSTRNTGKISVIVNGNLEYGESDGVGPVNALDKALRIALSRAYPTLKSISLIDYKVRVLDSINATSAKVRVLITSTDANTSWSTIGVSDDIIMASYLALSDSINYYLIHNHQN